MGLMAGVLSLGPVLGPVVGGIVLQGLGWRWMFLINLPIGLVAFLGALRVLPGDLPRGERTDVGDQPGYRRQPAAQRCIRRAGDRPVRP
jgi:MFS family permease